MAYRKNADRDEDKAKAYELEQVMLTGSYVLAAQHLFLELKSLQGSSCAEELGVGITSISAIKYFREALRCSQPLLGRFEICFPP